MQYRTSIDNFKEFIWVITIACADAIGAAGGLDNRLS